MSQPTDNKKGSTAMLVFVIALFLLTLFACTPKLSHSSYRKTHRPEYQDNSRNYFMYRKDCPKQIPYQPIKPYSHKYLYR
jgi:hypothetical protein